MLSFPLLTLTFLSLPSAGLVVLRSWRVAVAVPFGRSWYRPWLQLLRWLRWARHRLQSLLCLDGNGHSTWWYVHPIRENCPVAVSRSLGPLCRSSGGLLAAGCCKEPLQDGVRGKLGPSGATGHKRVEGLWGFRLFAQLWIRMGQLHQQLLRHRLLARIQAQVLSVIEGNLLHAWAPEGFRRAADALERKAGWFSSIDSLRTCNERLKRLRKRRGTASILAARLRFLFPAVGLPPAIQLHPCLCTRCCRIFRRGRQQHALQWLRLLQKLGFFGNGRRRRRLLLCVAVLGLLCPPRVPQCPTKLLFFLRRPSLVPMVQLVEHVRRSRFQVQCVDSIC
mmetsp:Transcript_37159/g.87205  ORF Transcript_37159/g.87205 Transcript_37159/m.87205 type:complete len:336 (+) Transcript_37159:594-1601(+)